MEQEPTRIVVQSIGELCRELGLSAEDVAEAVQRAFPPRPRPGKAEEPVSAGNRLIDKIIEQLNEEEAQERQREADRARPVPPPIGGYRSAPLACRKEPPRAPRASWWRRLWHRGVVDRMDLRCRRHALRLLYPGATWRERRDLAEAEQDRDAARGDDAVIEVLDAEDRRAAILIQIEARAPTGSGLPAADASRALCPSPASGRIDA